MDAILAQIEYWNQICLQWKLMSLSKYHYFFKSIAIAYVSEPVNSPVIMIDAPGMNCPGIKHVQGSA